MELAAIVPAYPSVAVRLLIKKSEHECGMLDFIGKYSGDPRAAKFAEEPPRLNRNESPRRWWRCLIN